MTNFDEIKRMLDLMDERGLEEIEVEREGFRVRLRKPARGAAEARPAPVAPPPPDAPAPAPRRRPARSLRTTETTGSR